MRCLNSGKRGNLTLLLLTADRATQPCEDYRVACQQWVWIPSGFEYFGLGLDLIFGSLSVYFQWKIISTYLRMSWEHLNCFTLQRYFNARCSKYPEEKLLNFKVKSP